MLGQASSHSGMVPDQPHIMYDKTKTLKLNHPGAKYLIVENISSDQNNIETLTNVSPFLIKKVVDSTCNGEVEVCKKLKNGTLLIKTKNLTQAQKLVQLRSFAHNINIKVSEHNSLNFVKGVLYSNDLRGLSNEEIVTELKQQNVVKVDKILKKINNVLTETGLIIVTFASLSLPEELFIGYKRVRVRTYIPLRCKNCYIYGHTAKTCTNKKICPNCANAYHTNDEAKEKCNITSSCINCQVKNIIPSNHAAYHKACPVFPQEKEIKAIISLDKVSRGVAIAKYNDRHLHKSASSHTTFATVTKTSNPNLETTIPRTQTSYADLSEDAPAAKLPTIIKPTGTKPKTAILRRKTSKRLKQKLIASMSRNSKQQPNPFELQPKINIAQQCNYVINPFDIDIDDQPENINMN